MSVRRMEIDYRQLQAGQMHHDQIAHQDIWTLAVPHRLTHFTLHFAKYIGALVTANKTNDTELKKRVLTDSLVIALATANAVQVDLATSVETPNERSNTADIRLLPRQFDSLTLELAEVVGRMAKACEAFDHAEKFPSRDVIEHSVSRLIPVIEGLAEIEGLDIVSCVTERWAAVEMKCCPRMWEQTWPVASEPVAA